MLKRINHTEHAPSTMGYRLDGDIDAVMMETLSRELGESIEKNGDVNVLVELGKIDSTHAAGLMRSLKDVGEDAAHIQRLAWVTDDARLTAVGKIASVLPGVNVKHFSVGDQVAAWRWAATGETPTA